MRRHQEVDERLAEDILRGRVAALEGEDRALAETMATLRDSAASVPSPTPSEQLLQVFSEGIPAQDREGAALVGAAGTARRAPTRGRTALRPSLAKLAGLSLAAKIALAGTAAAAAGIGGAGAAWVLPGQGDGLPPAEHVEEAEADFGRDVADEATDADGGVDGPAVSEEARLLRERGARADAEAREAERREEARQQREEPGQRVPSEAEERPDGAPSTAPRSGDEGRGQADERTGGTPGQAPTERAPVDDRAGQPPEPGEPVPDRTETPDRPGTPERERDTTSGTEADERSGAQSGAANDERLSPAEAGRP